MRKLLNRVPEVTLFFWIIKIMATTVGETAADFLSATLNLGLGMTSYIMGVLLVAALVIQFRLKRYVPASYWVVVVLVSIVGTLITDRLVDEAGVSLVTTSILFGAALLLTFALWYASEKTLSIHSIHTAKREIFYWAAILFTFALSTAAGDLFAEGMQLGYAPSALIFGAIIALVAFAHYVFRMNAVLAFWLAYILTRPLGASMGDWLSQPLVHGGLGLGTIGTSAIFLIIITGLVSYISLQQNKQQRVPANVK